MSRKRSRWLPWWLPWRLRPRSTYVLTWSGWPDSNRRPPAPKLNLITERGGLEESCRSTELGSCRQGAFRTSLDSLSLGSHIGSPPPRSDQVRAHVTHLWTAGRIVRLRPA